MAYDADVQAAVEKFAAVLEDQKKRIARMKEEKDFVDYKKLDKIIIGVCGGDGIGPAITHEAQRILEFLLDGEVKKGKVEFKVIDGLTIENRVKANKAIPDDVIDAAKIDGCNLMQVLRCVVIPIARGGIISAGILAFLDSWNMVEQPLAYLKNFTSYPLSVALSVVFPSEVNVQMAASLLVLIPPLLLFLYFNRDLVEGIVIGEEK